MEKETKKFTKKELLVFYKKALKEFSEAEPEDFESAKVCLKKKTGEVREFNLNFLEHTMPYLVSVIEPFVKAKINMIKEEIKKGE